MKIEEKKLIYKATANKPQQNARLEIYLIHPKFAESKAGIKNYQYIVYSDTNEIIRESKYQYSERNTEILNKYGKFFNNIKTFKPKLMDKHPNPLTQFQWA